MTSEINLISYNYESIKVEFEWKWNVIECLAGLFDIYVCM